MIPKFRAWDIENREMIWVDEINFGMEIVGTYIGTDERGDPGFGYLNFKQVILMQSIGRTGMNKNDDEVDIFKGDIIQVIEQGHQMGFYVENEYVGVVEYDKGHCTYYLNLITTNYHNELPDEIDGIPIFKGDEEPERYYFNDDLFLVPEDIQILGNIHENPYLLKGNKGELSE